MPSSSRRLLIAVVLATIASSACTGQNADPGSIAATTVVAVRGAADPASAVSELMSALAAGEYDRAADLTVDDQMVAIAVAEDSSVASLSAVLEDGGGRVAANYWQGFTANLEELLGVGPADVTVGRVTPMEVDGIEFARVTLDLPVDSVQRRVIVRNVDGWKVDVVASFAPTLAVRLGRAAESLRADPTASEVLAALSLQRPSLEAALAGGGLDVETEQVVRTAVVSLGG